MKTVLTDEEIGKLVREANKLSAIKRDGTTSQRIARAIEAAVLDKFEFTAEVDKDDDNQWADILPDRSVKVGEKLYALKDKP